MRAGLGTIAAAVLLAAVASADAVAQQTEHRLVQTVQALAPLEAYGRLVKSGAEEASFVGIVNGPVYRNSGADFEPVAEMHCAVLGQVDLASGAQGLSGRCRLIGRTGAEAFARVSCQGSYGVGCSGEFELIEGTGSMAGAKGRGEMRFRTRFLEISTVEDMTVVEQTTAGLAWWPDFSLITPLLEQ